MANASGVTPKDVVRLILTTIFGVPLFIYLVIKIFTSGMEVEQLKTDKSEETVRARLLPVGEVKIIVSAPAGSRSGQAVYDTVCTSCHTAGMAGAPKFGDKIAWASHLAKGIDVLVQHALIGFNAMPAKGGDPTLTDDEVKRAVVYMSNAAGAKFKEPPIEAISLAANKVDLRAKGKEIYDTLCVSCHNTGLSGAPQFGNKKQWAPRLTQGIDAAIQIGISGKGAMPPKGGYAGSDHEFVAAARYLIENSQ